MTQLQIDGAAGTSTIIVGESMAELPQYCTAERCVIVTDRRVAALYGRQFPSWPIIEIGRGEAMKTLRTVGSLYNAFLEKEIDRSSFLVAIGGGIVCDVAGFAASTFLRGLPFGFVPSTLLAQVDAGVGGKNGVNFMGYKNLVGTITQPRFVLCDPALLTTLPKAEVRNGFAEAVKQAAIGDASFFSYLEEHCEEALSLEPDVIRHVVYASLSVKKWFVTADEREQGERRKLNFGHTLGHALEAITHCRHGEAISVGMVAASRLSVLKGRLSAGHALRLEELLKRFGLPVRMETTPDERLWHALARDKKRENETIHFVLLDEIGRAGIAPIRIGELNDVLKDLCQPR